MVGDNITIYDLVNTLIDASSLMSIELGNNVQITTGCIVLDHDYSYSVAVRVYKSMPRK